MIIFRLAVEESEIGLVTFTTYDAPSALEARAISRWRFTAAFFVHYRNVLPIRLVFHR